MISLQDKIYSYTVPMMKRLIEENQKLKEEVLEFYRTGIKKELEKRGFDTRFSFKFNSPESRASDEIIDNFGREKYDYGVSLFHVDIKKYFEKDFIQRAKKTEAQMLKKGEVSEFDVYNINPMNGFEGTFTANGKKYYIQTIIAGGYNVQKKHYRTIIK